MTRIIMLITLLMLVSCSKAPSLSEKIAEISYGRDVLTNGIEHQRVEKILKPVAKECEMTESKLADFTILLSNKIKKEGKSIMPVEILEGLLMLRNSFPHYQEKESCNTILYFYGNATINQNSDHWAAISKLLLLVHEIDAESLQ